VHPSKHLSKVLWSEGMSLGPQHFQAQNRYVEDTVQFSINSLWFASYGLIQCKLNHEVLRNGTLSLEEASGIFKDGLPFEIPQADLAPPPRKIGNLISATSESVMAVLAIPRFKQDGANMASPDPGSVSTSRYLSDSKLLFDENTGRDEKSVGLSRKNLRLLLASEVSEDLEVLPIGRILRDETGHLVFDSKYIPPVVKIDASPRLVQLVKRLIEVLEEKSKSLSVDKSGIVPAALDRFWLLHAINSNLALLKHLADVKRGHPEELYLVLARLAGALSTFHIGTHPRDLPLYSHDDLTACFESLDQTIRRQLEVFLPTNAISITLRVMQKFFYYATVSDKRCLGQSQWVLAVESEMNEAELIRKTPDLIKICSRKFIAKLVQRALPGLQLIHLSTPPNALSTGSETKTQYFEIQKSGPCWESILDSSELGVYVPGELADSKLELSVVLGSE